MDFARGALAALFFVAGVLFLRLWKIARDRFFLMFAAAFWTLSLHRIALALIDVEEDTRPYYYLIKLAAFTLMIGAIIDKNRPRSRAERS